MHVVKSNGKWQYIKNHGFKFKLELFWWNFCRSTMFSSLITNLLSYIAIWTNETKRCDFSTCQTRNHIGRWKWKMNTETNEPRISLFWAPCMSILLDVHLFRHNTISDNSRNCQLILPLNANKCNSNCIITLFYPNYVGDNGIYYAINEGEPILGASLAKDQ